jgi:hypothetical protein
MFRFGTVLLAAVATLSLGATIANADPMVFRSSVPAVLPDGTVTGFVCRANNLVAPAPATAVAMWRDADGHVLEQKAGPIVGGTLAARGISCGYYAVKAKAKTASTNICVRLLTADKQPLSEACTG